MIFWRMQFVLAWQFSAMRLKLHLACEIYLSADRFKTPIKNLSCSYIKIKIIIDKSTFLYVKHDNIYSSIYQCKSFPMKPGILLIYENVAFYLCIVYEEIYKIYSRRTTLRRELFTQYISWSITLTEILPVPITLLEPYEATISRTFELREHDSRIWLSMLVRLFYIPSTIPTYFWFLLHVGCIFLDKI